MLYLSLGSSGPAVRDLQTRLNQVQKPVPPLVTDGIFGPKTDAAVRAFQGKACPPADGIVGPKTQAALEAAPPPPDPGPRCSTWCPARCTLRRTRPCRAGLPRPRC